MTSLAPLKFRAVSCDHGGPIDRLECGNGVDLPVGSACYHASAFLREDLFPRGYRRGRFSFDAPDGAGTHEIQQVACHMAISEAIERWALHHLRAHGVTDRYGLDLDPSSNGFSAFPGLTSRPARRKAMAEAVERHCLLCWWEGLLHHHPLPDPSPGVKAIRLENPFGRRAVAVVWGIHRGLHYTYGFGEGKDVGEACRRSLIERDRCSAIIDHHLEGRRNDSLRDPDIAAVADPFERRILHFSRARGFRLFHERLKRDCTTPAKRGANLRPPAPSPSDGSGLPTRRLGDGDPGAKPAIHFDGNIPGPWSRYATVWRTVIVPPTRRHLEDGVEFFFW